jgi:hypothetical protein
MPELAQALKEHRDRQQRLDERGSGYGHGTRSDDFVFMTDVGTFASVSCNRTMRLRSVGEHRR